MGKQGSGRDRKVLTASLAAEPESARRAASLVNGRAFTMDANRLAFRSCPAGANEGRLSFLVRHAQDGR